jgi:general nucleoside transport system ATP-binding protein
MSTLLMNTPVIEMKGISKYFGSLRANNRVDFTLEKGSIHALLGENGAGKSTLMNILTGLYHPDEGEIFVRGEKRSINSPRDAYALGIGMVHQHFMLIPKLTVAENIVLGLKTGKSPLLDLSEVVDRLEKLSRTYRIQVDPHALVGDLTVGEQQRVEIMKLLYRDADILILDEPTAVLTPQEVESLCSILHAMAEDGFSVVLITHKLEEALSVCSKIDVLRDGALIDSVPAKGVNRQSLARMMVGRDVVFQYECEDVEKGDVVLEADSISVESSSGKPILQGLSLQLHRGEILGVAGVSGNGQSDLAKAVAGIRRIDQGKIFLEGRDITNDSVEALIRRGISYIPDDRHLLGMFPEMTIKENLLVKEHNQAPYARYGIQNSRVIEKHAKEIISSYKVKTPSIELPMKSLSGGNQQKVVLARELSLKPRLVIADQPTRGLDVGAIEYIHKLLLAGRSSGMAILLISTELEEILNLSDRIIVMYEGRITFECDAKCADLEQIGLAMAGEFQE